MALGTFQNKAIGVAFFVLLLVVIVISVILIKTKNSFLEIFEIESDTKLKVGDRLGK
jgi:hypothetical protein